MDFWGAFRSTNLAFHSTRRWELLIRSNEHLPMNDVRKAEWQEWVLRQSHIPTIESNNDFCSTIQLLMITPPDLSAGFSEICLVRKVDPSFRLGRLANCCWDGLISEEVIKSAFHCQKFWVHHFTINFAVNSQTRSGPQRECLLSVKSAEEWTVLPPTLCPCRRFAVKIDCHHQLRTNQCWLFKRTTVKCDDATARHRVSGRNILRV
jgi:hypothetical protein